MGFDTVSAHTLSSGLSAFFKVMSIFPGYWSHMCELVEKCCPPGPSEMAVPGAALPLAKCAGEWPGTPAPELGSQGQTQQPAVPTAFGCDSPSHRESTLAQSGRFAANKYLTS